MINYMSQKFTKALGLIALTGLSTLVDAQSNINWSPAGPIFTAGRSRNMVVDKNDPTGKTLYTGSASSGVFTTTNGGISWLPLNDQGTVRNISYMAQGSDGTIYASTGEGFLRVGQSAKAQIGTGLYRVDLVQKTLIPVAPASITGTVINRIACSNSGNIVAIAGSNGILISANGFAGPFNQATGIQTGAGISGQDIKFDSNNNIYCSVGSEKSNAIPTRVYKALSSNNLSFSDITPPQGILSSSLYGRIELGISPSNPSVVYASVANKAPFSTGVNPGNIPSMKGLFVSYNGGTSWGLIIQGSPALDPLSNGANIATGDYAQVISVSPTNPDQILIAGYRLYLYTRTGGSDSSPFGSWIPLGMSSNAFIPQYYLHENIHDIKVVGSGLTAKHYFVTDAGIFRSSDFATASLINNIPPSFQPFYSGLVTGQFNSVSIKSHPSSTTASLTSNGGTVAANDAFIGGTGGNGLTYFDGKFPVANEEVNYLSGLEIYNCELSKILPNAAFFTGGPFGGVYRVSDVRTSQPDLVSVVTYSGSLTKIVPISYDFANEAVNSSGSPFKLWENYGQLSKSPDSLVFYNDSSRIVTSIVGGIATLTTQSTFTFSAGRPNKFAMIDSIAIRTGTFTYEQNGSNVPTPFTAADKKDIFIKLANNYAVNPTITTPSIALKTGPVAAAGVTLNATTNFDDISVTFTAPPYMNKTTFSYSSNYSADPAVYYKVFATIFYKYKVGDTISFTDNSISTKIYKYDIKLSTPLRWTKTGNNGPKPATGSTNPLQKVAVRFSARLAVAYRATSVTGSKYSVVVSKAPLNLNDPLSFVRVSADGALTDDANGNSTTNPISIPGKPIILEWSKKGTELYYATDDNKLYRVSHIGTILDNTPSSYSGKLTTDIFKFNYPVNTSSLNPTSPYRTTLLGSFTKTITSISISKNDSSMLLTFNDPTGVLVMYSGNNIAKSDASNINFSSKTGNLTNVATYCSLIEKNDPKQVFIGTDNGLFYTSNITAGSPVWTNVNNNQLPNVQIFDIKQQTLENWNSYNSGQIYVATNGRGVWTNRSYFAPYVVSVNEIPATITTENNLSIYPNPTNGQVNVRFSVVDGESASVSVMDINGRIVKTESLGKLYSEQANYSFETSDLSSGMYIVSINSSAGVKRVAKLVVTK
ncbi:MAG: T9SS type A sorting domain-containing protein [Bacteroidota bacterium]